MKRVVKNINIPKTKYRNLLPDLKGEEQRQYIYANPTLNLTEKTNKQGKRKKCCDSVDMICIPKIEEVSTIEKPINEQEICF